MARQRRFAVPDQPQHVIQRGNNREIIFAADQDYLFYLEKLEEACRRFGCQIHAYVLMTNHVHFLLTPSKQNAISLLFQRLGRTFVTYVNKTYQRSGTLWGGRHKGNIIESESYFYLVCSILS